MRSRLPIALLLLALCPALASGQTIRRVVPAESLDTTATTGWQDAAWRAPVAEIYRGWRQYLLAGRGTPEASAYWISTERLGLPIYDLTTVVDTGGDDLTATVLDIRPPHPDSTNQYVVRTLISRVVGQDVQPTAVIRVWAVQENGKWVFANALPRLTSQWLRADVDRISYVITPDGLFDRSRAEDFVAFTDSVASRFGIDRLPPLIYYFANDAEELNRALGVDWRAGQNTAGYPLWQDHILLSGSAGFAESNRHDAIHILLSKLAADGRTHPIVDEGVSTWLGGSRGLTFDQLMKEYANYLRGNPNVTVDTVLGSKALDRGWDPTGAAIVLLVYEKGGFSAVKDLYTSGASDAELRAAASRLTGLSWAELGTRVRARILQLAEAN